MGTGYGTEPVHAGAHRPKQRLAFRLATEQSAFQPIAKRPDAVNSTGNTVGERQCRRDGIRWHRLNCQKAKSHTQAR